MMIPRVRLLVLLAVWASLGLLASWNDGWGRTGWWVGAGLLGGVMLLDAWRVYRQPAPRLERELPRSWAVDAWHSVTLEVHADVAQAGLLVDQYPADWNIRGLPVALAVPAQGWTQVVYECKPVRRGPAQFAAAQMRLTSPWGLWWRQVRLGAAHSVRVYPNFASVARYALMLTDHRVAQMGIIKKRRRGEGMDFHQLREFRDGDSLRAVDWKATSRMNKLIAREYQDERDQQVIFLLDGGRRMLAQDGALSHFDHTLNALLLLAYTALRQGDAVGLMSFACEPRWMAPCKAVGSVNRLLNVLYDLQPTLESSDFLAAAELLMRRVNKRSLVVVLSNLRDEDDENMIEALKLMRKKHLVLLSSLRESALDQTREGAITDFSSALERSALELYLAERRRVFERWQHMGIEVLDTVPEQLPVALVNAYLDLKMRGVC